MRTASSESVPWAVYWSLFASTGRRSAGASFFAAPVYSTRTPFGPLDKPPGHGLASHVSRCSYGREDPLAAPPWFPKSARRPSGNIIRFELGEGIDGLDVSLRFAEERLRWQLDASGPQAATPECQATYRGRLVDALRAAGKPVE